MMSPATGAYQNQLCDLLSLVVVVVCVPEAVAP